jgi:hypothetical protein
MSQSKEPKVFFCDGLLPSAIPQTAISVCDSRNQSFGGLATQLFQKRKLPPDTANQVTVIVTPL